MIRGGLESCPVRKSIGLPEPWTVRSSCLPWLEQRAEMALGPAGACRSRREIPVSPAKTKFLSSAIAFLAGTATIPAVLLTTIRGFPSVGFRPSGNESNLILVLGVVASALAGYEVFRWTFNALCERWSEEAVPARIRRYRDRRNVVRSSG